MFAELVGVPLGTGPVKGVLKLLWCRRKEPHPICPLVVRTPLKAWHLLSTCCVPGTVLSAVNVKLTHSYSEQPSGSQAHLPLAPCPCCALCEAYCSYGSSLGMPDSKLSLQRDLLAYLWPPVIDCSHLTRIFFIMHCSIWNCLFFFLSIHLKTQNKTPSRTVLCVSTVIFPTLGHVCLQQELCECLSSVGGRCYSRFMG